MKQRLSEFITLQRGFDLPASQRVLGEVPVVASTGIVAWHNLAKVKAPGVVIGRSGSIGGGQFVEQDFWPLNTTLYVKDFKGNNPRYAYYALKTIDFSAFNAGAGVPTLNRNHIASIEIEVLPRPIQDRIAGILSDYDLAIANCRKQIALLEEAAMRLYREWFKDGKWEKKRIGDVIEFDPPTKLRKGVRRFSVPMGALQINSMVLDKDEFEITTGNSGSKFRNGDTLLARITPCLENGKTAFVFGVDEEGSCGSTEFIVMRSKRLNPYMVYLLARTEQFRKVAIASMAGADGRQRARKEVIADYEILVPSPEAIEKLGKIHKPMFSQIEALANQIRTLTEARDRLLPKLMKGEVAV